MPKTLHKVKTRLVLINYCRSLILIAIISFLKKMIQRQKKKCLKC